MPSHGSEYYCVVLLFFKNSRLPLKSPPRFRLFNVQLVSSKLFTLVGIFVIDLQNFDSRGETIPNERGKKEDFKWRVEGELKKCAIVVKRWHVLPKKKKKIYIPVLRALALVDPLFTGTVSIKAAIFYEDEIGCRLEPGLARG